LRLPQALLFCSLYSIPGLSQAVPADIQAIAAKATAAREQGDVSGAIALYDQALATDPQWLEGWWFLGNLEYGSDQYELARSALSHYIDLAPHAPAAFALRGLCEFETAAYPASLSDIQQAIALGAANQPRNQQILLYHEALLLARLGRFEESIAKYTGFVKQGIINPDVETGLGLAGLRMPLLPRELDPADAPFVSRAGQAALQVLTGDVSGGRQAFQSVLAAFPNRPYVHYFCGYLLFTNNPDQAVEEFRLELAADPSNALAHAMLAWASEFRGEYAEALPEAQAAVAAQPSLLMSQLVLGRALVETTDISDALPHLDQVVAADPSNLEAHLSLAKAYSKLGRKDDARRERLLSLELSSKFAGQGAYADANR
jgi:tetratricopeptide (TPR) repeat protein